MNRFALTAVLGTSVIGLAAGGDYDRTEAAYDNGANATGYAEGEAAGANYAGTATAGGSWPAGSRIVVEEGVTYRIEPGGARIRLGPEDARIVVEDGVRYRVDPSGTRIRIDESGAEIRVDGDVSVPVDANTSVTVNTP